MGFVDFEDIAEQDNIWNAYRHQVAQAKYWLGRSGSTGSIAETDGYEVIVPEPLSEKKARAFAQNKLRNSPEIEFGRAYAIRLKSGWFFYGIAHL